METRSYVDYSRAEAGFRSWQRADLGWEARAARGSGAAGVPKGTRTSYFYGGGFYPFGRTWGGGGFPPSKNCPIGPPPPTPCVSIDPLNPCPSPSASPPPEGPPTPTPKPTKPPKP